MLKNSPSKTSISTVLFSLTMAFLVIMPSCKFNCSTGGGYDKAEVVKVIAEQLSLTGVTCPDSDNPKTGTTFVCTGVDSEGAERQVTVTFKDDNYKFEAVID